MPTPICSLCKLVVAKTEGFMCGPWRPVSEKNVYETIKFGDTGIESYRETLTPYHFKCVGEWKMKE